MAFSHLHTISSDTLLQSKACYLEDCLGIVRGNSILWVLALFFKDFGFCIWISVSISTKSFLKCLGEVKARSPGLILSPPCGSRNLSTWAGIAASWGMHGLETDWKQHRQDSVRASLNIVTLKIKFPTQNLWETLLCQDRRLSWLLAIEMHL